MKAKKTKSSKMYKQAVRDGHIKLSKKELKKTLNDVRHVPLYWARDYSSKHEQWDNFMAGVHQGYVQGLLAKKKRAKKASKKRS